MAQDWANPPKKESIHNSPPFPKKRNRFTIPIFLVKNESIHNSPPFSKKKGIDSKMNRFLPRFHSRGIDSFVKIPFFDSFFPPMSVSYTHLTLPTIYSV